ncbi:HNH endonuclease signature motif containing protein [Serinicoccus kebangsaanensis]|uniref:HNH endonuclease signature motif containing protein n=1 Tax=Serinicoccus kebangsaanensis TaxID=2602069 RepID=UPI00124D4D6F|nr:HNH endonuclease signature motif containing protein [Serinicoccus kebangsaanensis]
MAAVSTLPTSGESDALQVLGVLAATRSGVDARLIETTRLIVAAIADQLLVEKGFSAVGELTDGQRRRWRAEAKRLACAEVELKLGAGVTEARQLVGLACAPVGVRTDVIAALDRGEITWLQARSFWKRCGSLPVDSAEVVSEALFGTDPAAAAPERLDPQGELRERPWHEADYAAALQREAVRAEGQDVQAERERRRAAYAARRAELVVHDDGTGTLSVTGPLISMCAAHTRIERAARLLRKQGDPRTLDQLRADVTAALLVHGSVAPPATHDELGVPDLGEVSRVVSALPAVELQVVVPWDALAGTDAPTTVNPTNPTAPTEPTDPTQPTDPTNLPRAVHHPCDDPPRCRRARRGVGLVLGRHPAYLTPGQIRELALQHGTTLRRLLTDPADGRLIERSLRAYRPDAAMRRQVLAADVHARAPGSRHPGTSCEIDHVLPWGEAGGSTTETNLALLGKRHHQLKTAGHAFAEINDLRDLTWTTLLGQAETTRAHDYRQYLDGTMSRDAQGQDWTASADRPDPDRSTSAHAPAPDRADVGEDDWIRRDRANRALYAALAHRGPDAFLTDADDHLGSAEHGGALGGWLFVTRTTPGGARRHGAAPDTETVGQVLGFTEAEAPSGPAAPARPSPTSSTGRDAAPPRDDEGAPHPRAPWRPTHDQPPPF